MKLPLLDQVVPGGINYGSTILVEFQPDSLWYETSLTIAAEALRDRIRTDYHTFQHMPIEVRKPFAEFGLDVERLEDEDALRIIDSFTIQTGLSATESPRKSRVPSHYSQSLKLSDWSIANLQRIKSGVPEEDKRRLHIDDNTGILLQYNDEKVFIDNWRTRSRPHTVVQQIVLFNSLITGAASEAFTKQFEALSDGVIDFKSEEKEGRIEHYFRVRVMRGKPYDSRWRQLRVLDSGEVSVV